MSWKRSHQGTCDFSVFGIVDEATREQELGTSLILAAVKFVLLVCNIEFLEFSIFLGSHFNNILTSAIVLEVLMSSCCTRYYLKESMRQENAGVSELLGQKMSRKSRKLGTMCPSSWCYCISEQCACGI